MEPPQRSTGQLSAKPMNFDDFCRRARLYALTSKTAHYVTYVNGHYAVTTSPASTTVIRYVAVADPQTRFPTATR